jgi:Type IV secretion system pilin
MELPVAKLPSYSGTGFLFEGKTVGDIVGGALKYVLVIAGLGLLLMLIMGGITLMTAAGDPKKAEQGYGYIKGGLIGFLIIFIAYFVMQIVSVVLGVTIF